MVSREVLSYYGITHLNKHYKKQDTWKKQREQEKKNKRDSLLASPFGIYSFWFSICIKPSPC